MSATSVVSGWLRGKREEMNEEEEEVEEEDEEEEEEEEEEGEEAAENEAEERLRIKGNDCNSSISLPTIPTYNQQGGVGGGGMWAKTAGSRAAVGRLKSRLFETRLAAHVKQAHIAITDSLKQAGWAVEHKVSEVSRRGWSEATRAWGSGGPGGGTLALTGGSGGPHERSSLLLGPGDGYQRLDNNKSNDGWGDDGWTSDWGNGNNSNVSSPTQTRMESPNPSPNGRVAKKNNNNSNKSKGSVKNKGNAEEELLVDINSTSGGGGGNNKGHTWDNWDDDWEKIDGQ